MPRGSSPSMTPRLHTGSHREPWPSSRVHLLPDRAARLHSARGFFMNNIIYLVGLVVVVLAILSFLGLR